MNLRRSKAPGFATDRPGESFEKIVARIQSLLDPATTVTHNERLVDRVGNSRQFDVVVRGQFGGRHVLGVLECKDHSRRKGPDAIEAFAKKTENLGANLRVVVSRRGFTAQALRLAAHEHIGCVSLLPDTQQQLGFSIGEWWYGTLKDWTNITIGFHPLLKDEQPWSFGGYEVLVNDRPAINWFLRELLTKYADFEQPGEQVLSVQFARPIKIRLRGADVEVTSLYATAMRVLQRKRRWVNWSGDALYDWHTGTFTVPAGGFIQGSVVESDLTLWPDDPTPENAELPTLSFLRMTVTYSPKWSNALDDQVPDLPALGNVE